MPERRTIAVVTAVVVVLGVVLALLLTASTDSALGRVRAQVGDAADSVGSALSAPSPPPTATASAAPTAEEVRSREAAVRVRALMAQASAHLDRGDDASRRLALGELTEVTERIVDVLDKDGVDALRDEAQVLLDRLAAKPVPVATTPAR